MTQKITQLVEQLVLPILEKEKLELVDIEYKKEGNNWFLRVYIDKESGGVDIEDCGRVSEALSAELDKKDPVPYAYFLEVSSPGAERPLKTERDIIKSIGKNVYITTYEPVNNQKVIEGKLIGYEGDILKINDNKIIIEILYEKIASIRLAVVF